MVNVYLHGLLGRKFNKSWRLAVSSVSEAIKAIDINTNGRLREYLGGEAREKKYMVKIGDYYLRDKEELVGSSGSKDIHIVPYTKGASAAAKIIAGVVLVVVGAILYYYGGGFLVKAGMGLMMMGASLTLGGIVQMLTPVANFNSTDDSTTRGSNIFEGNSINVSQGGSVGLAYGRVLVSPMPISVSIINEDKDVTTAIDLNGVNGSVLEGGGYQYNSGSVIYYIPSTSMPYYPGNDIIPPNPISDQQGEL